MTTPLQVEFDDLAEPVVWMVSISGNTWTQLSRVARGPTPAWLYPKW